MGIFREREVDRIPPLQLIRLGLGLLRLCASTRRRGLGCDSGPTVAKEKQQREPRSDCGASHRALLRLRSLSAFRISRLLPASSYRRRCSSVSVITGGTFQRRPSLSTATKVRYAELTCLISSNR